MATRFIVPDSVCKDPHQFYLRAADLRVPEGDRPYMADHAAEADVHGVFLNVTIVTAQFPIDEQIGFVRQSSDWHSLMGACYDAHQCYDGWQDGDVIAINVMLPLGGAQVVEFARVHEFHLEPLTSPTLVTRDDWRKPLPLVLAAPSPEASR